MVLESLTPKALFRALIYLDNCSNRVSTLLCCSTGFYVKYNFVEYFCGERHEFSFFVWLSLYEPTNHTRLCESGLSSDFPVNGEEWHV